MPCEPRDDDKLAILAVYISAIIARFSHKLRFVFIFLTLLRRPCLVVAGRDDVAHDDVTLLQEI